jgi:hypothetical protein
METQISTTQTPTSILSEVRKEVGERLRLDQERGRVCPIICYALDDTLLPQDVWDSIRNADQSSEYYFLNVISVFSPLSLLIWVRTFYEFGNGRDVWECLNDTFQITSSERPKVKNILIGVLKAYFCWQNKLSNQKQWRRWMPSQCWVLSMRTAGQSSSLVYNNIRLSGYLDDEVKGENLVDYVAAEWQEQETPPYIQVIAEKYQDYVTLSLRSLCGLISDEELNRNPWLQRIKDDSWQDRERIKADWYLRDNNVWLVFKGRKQRIDLNGHKFRLRSGGIPLQEILSVLSRNTGDDDSDISLSPEKIKELWKVRFRRGFMISYGSRLPSLDLDRPQLFLGSEGKIRLIQTINCKVDIETSAPEAYVYLPRSYSSSYSLSYGPRSSFSDFPLVLVSSQDDEFEIYRAKLVNVQQFPLYLYDCQLGREIFCFTEKFGLGPKIRMRADSNRKLKRTQIGNTFFLVGESAEFELENPPGTHFLKWELTTPKGDLKSTKLDLHKYPALYKFQGFIWTGQYKLECYDSNENILDWISIVYIADESLLSRRTDMENLDLCKIPTGYGLFQLTDFKCNGVVQEIIRPLNSGEGIWMWKNQGKIATPPMNALTPVNWMADYQWKLKLDLGYIRENGELDYDWQNLRLNGISITLILDDASIEELSSRGERGRAEYDNFLSAIFMGLRIAPMIYQYFSYKEIVKVTYDSVTEGRVELFSFINDPHPDLRRVLLLSGDANGISTYLWCPRSKEHSKDAYIDGELKATTFTRVSSLLPLYRCYNRRYDRISTVDLGNNVELRTSINRTRRDPGRRRKDIITIINTALDSQYNMFSEQGGDAWLSEHLFNQNKKQKLEEQLFAYLNKNYSCIRRIVKNDPVENDPSGATLMFGILAFLKQDDNAITDKLKSFSKNYPDKFTTLGSLIEYTYANDDSVRWMLENNYWISANSFIGLADYVNCKTYNVEQTEIKNIDDLYQFLCDATSTCGEECFESIDDELAKDIFKSYINICCALDGLWGDLAKDITNIDDKLGDNGHPISRFVFEVVFCCRVHRKLIGIYELRNRLLPLDYSSDGNTKNMTYISMISCLRSIMRSPGLLLAFLFSLSATEQYLDKRIR